MRLPDRENVSDAQTANRLKATQVGKQGRKFLAHPLENAGAIIKMERDVSIGVFVELVQFDRLTTQRDLPRKSKRDGMLRPTARSMTSPIVDVNPHCIAIEVSGNAAQ